MIIQNYMKEKIYKYAKKCIYYDKSIDNYCLKTSLKDYCFEHTTNRDDYYEMTLEEYARLYLKEYNNRLNPNPYCFSYLLSINNYYMHVIKNTPTKIRLLFIYCDDLSTIKALKKCFYDKKNTYFYKIKILFEASR